MKRKLVSMIGLAAAAGTLMIGVDATQASAESANISSWNTASSCGQFTPYYFCLYYHQNQQGSVWRSESPKVPVITALFGSDGPVRNDAASADNGTICNVGIWVSPSYQGNSDFLSPLKGGNLGPALRNNEASIAVDDHSADCAGMSI
jgi:Peptidase inhibitor family I36